MIFFSGAGFLVKHDLGYDPMGYLRNIYFLIRRHFTTCKVNIKQGKSKIFMSLDCKYILLGIKIQEKMDNSVYWKKSSKYGIKSEFSNVNKMNFQWFLLIVRHL